MKRILTFILFCSFVTMVAYSQGEIDALRMSRNDLTGTARAMGMGGAFGALGGDITGVAVNPAGIGVYRTSEIVTTMNFRNNKTSAELNTGKVNENKFYFGFDNLAFVGVFPLYDDAVPFINFGFSYNRLKNFTGKYNMVGNNIFPSLTDYMAERAMVSSGNITGSYPFDGTDWLPALASKSRIIQPVDGGFASVLAPDQRVNNDLFVEEKGGIDSYDFNVGTTISDIVSIGLSVSVTDINYRMYSSYREQAGNTLDFDLVNYLKTEGTGYQVKAGLIFKPIHELRIGIAYHSPTWYEMTDYANATLYNNIRPQDDTSTPHEEVFYDFRTPDKWIFSLAGVIGRTAIISMDYELTNYKSNMRFRNVYDSYHEEQNAAINEDYRNASALRIGAEVRFTPQLSGRIGYAWMQSPYNDNLTKNREIALVSGTIPHYILDGDAHYFTYGVGYRFAPNFYTDIAFVFKTQKDDLYTYPNYYYDKELIVENYKAKLTNNMFSGLVTVGYRF